MNMEETRRLFGSFDYNINMAWILFNKLSLKVWRNQHEYFYCDFSHFS